MKTIKELAKLMTGSYINGDYSKEDIGYGKALKDVWKLVEEVIKKHTKIHYHANRICPQAIRDELKLKIQGG